MSPPAPPANPKPTASAIAGRGYGAHLFDYPPAAARLWWVLALAGALTMAGAIAFLALEPPTEPGLLAGGLVAVMLASMVPVQLPGKRFAIAVADVFTLLLLAQVGPAAAVLAAGVEACITTQRYSSRLSSHISGPAAAMVAMAVAGLVFTGLQTLLLHLGMGAGAAALLALCTVAPLAIMLSSSALMANLTLKAGRRLTLDQWWSGINWIVALAIAQALLAGLVHVNAIRHGVALMATVSAVVLLLAVLIRATLARQERERRAQEALLTAAEQQAQLNQQRFTAAFTHAAIGMATVLPDGTIQQANRALSALLRMPIERLAGRPFSDLLHPGDAALLQRQAEAVKHPEGEAFSMEVRCVDQQGSEVWVALHVSHYADPGGAGESLIYQLHDITSRRQAEGRLHHIAFHDGLTDLANRQCFHERLEIAVERSRLDVEQRFAVMFLDLDRFKMVNDSLGHMVGNALLQEVAQRLRACVRPGDLVARLGGDEFAILLENVQDPQSGLAVAQRVLESLTRPVTLMGTEVVPGASVGITFSDLGYRQVDEVLRDADLAMYEAKAGGRGRVALFDSSMHERVVEKLRLEADLRRAIGEGQLSVHFQPIFDLQPYRLRGFEALARWSHPERGAISPAVFVTLAEECGHIDALTDWIIEHSAAQLAGWQARMPAARGLGVHVNISGRDLARPSLVAHVKSVLRRHALAPESLTLEITETTLMGRLDEALQTMGALRAEGVRFSIDDFGTGYSSLSYLSTLPIDSLKIDRSFVMGMNTQPQNLEIVRAVVNLAQTLGRSVIAEGIETAEQLETLRGLGVPKGQGYLLSRPLPAERAQELLMLVTPTEQPVSAPAAS